MDETKRLELIAEAVRYCQRVSKMGMPPSSYTKALREPVFFLWECRDGKSKDHIARFRSKRAVSKKRGSGELIYDHAVPFSYLEDELLALTQVTADTVRDVLSRHGVAVLITKEDDQRLNRAKLKNRMPANWDRHDSLARYRAAGIELVGNVTIKPRV